MNIAKPVIFFEASVLGQARHNRLARTGVYRVIVELLSELTRSHPDLVVIPFSRTPDLAGDLLASLKDLRLPLGLAPQQALTTSLLRFLLPNRFIPKRLASFAAKLKYAIYDLNLNLRVLLAKNIPIIQDTFLRTCLLGRCHRSFIVYDLIPILHSEWCQDGMFSQFDDFYSSVQSHDTVLCISNSTRLDLLRCFTQINPENCIVTYLAASEAFRPETDQQLIADMKDRVGIGASHPYFLSLCTLEPRKNLKAVIESFAQLSDHSDVGLSPRLVLTGQLGWSVQTELNQAVKELGIHDQIIFTGYLPDADLPALYSGAIAFVYPSLYEGFGLPVLEAMQCGTPVITSNCSSLPEVVGEAGILVDPTDSLSIAAAMATLMSSEDKQKSMSLQAIARAKHFSWTSAASELAAHYRTLLLNSSNLSG